MDSHTNICTLIKLLNIYDDSLVMNQKIKDLCLTQDFQNVANQHHMLKEAFITFNNCALNDTKFAVNLAFLFSSRSYDIVVENSSLARAEMLKTLQMNYINAENLRSQNQKHFYNSITLLGEYYNHFRNKSGPMCVLGRALFDSLAKQLEADTTKSLQNSSHLIDEEFAKLILTQVSLNGLLAQPTHKTEIDTLLFNIRKCLIKVSQLTTNVKALLLMTLDLYYSKFTNIGKELETMYSKLLVEPVENNESEAYLNTKSISAADEADNFSKLCKEMNGLNGGRNKQGVRIINEYIGRPVKASERLKFVQENAMSQRNKSETEEIRQEKLFEKEMLERNLESIKIIEQQASSDIKPTLDGSESLPAKANDDNHFTKSKSSKERKEDQAYFLVQPHLKASEPTPLVDWFDWYDDVENSGNNQTSPTSVNSESTKQSHTGYHSNSSNPTSPNEIRRGNFMNNSFRSMRSDSSTRSMGRIGNPRYEHKGYDNKRHYNRGNYNNSDGNYNNSFHNNRANHQQGQGEGNYQPQNQGHRRQNSDRII